MAKKCPRCKIGIEKTRDYCRPCQSQRTRIYRAKNPNYNKSEIRRRRKKVKLEIVEKYGGKCVCCGESRLEFLTIDHINGRNKGDKNTGYRMYYWLKRTKEVLKDVRILCWNCNCSRGSFGVCPHERERELGVVSNHEQGPLK